MFPHLLHNRGIGDAGVEQGLDHLWQIFNQFPVQFFSSVYHGKKGIQLDIADLALCLMRNDLGIGTDGQIGWDDGAGDNIGGMDDVFRQKAVARGAIEDQ